MYAMSNHAFQLPGIMLFSYLETVNPFDKSVFISFANSGIFCKWFDKSAFSRIAKTKGDVEFRRFFFHLFGVMKSEVGDQRSEVGSQRSGRDRTQKSKPLNRKP
jgi:hypothetical protein